MVDKLDAMSQLLSSGPIVENFVDFKGNKDKFPVVKKKIQSKVDDILEVLLTETGGTDEDKIAYITRVLGDIKKQTFDIMQEKTKLEKEQEANTKAIATAQTKEARAQLRREHDLKMAQDKADAKLEMQRAKQEAKDLLKQQKHNKQTKAQQKETKAYIKQNEAIKNDN